MGYRLPMPAFVPVVVVVVRLAPPVPLPIFKTFVFPMLVVVRSVPVSTEPFAILVVVLLVFCPNPTAGITVPLLVPPALVNVPEHSFVVLLAVEHCCA